MAKSERIRLLTPTFRVTFPDVFVKRVFQGQGEESGRYACAALFSGFEVKDGRTIIKAPAAWPEKDQARASVSPFANTHWKSLSLGLNNLQKLADGPRLDGITSAEDDFGADLAEYDARQQMWT